MRHGQATELVQRAEEQLQAAGLSDWSVTLEEDNLRGVAKCDHQTKSITLLAALANRPDYEVESLIRREVAHALQPKSYHKRSGLLRHKPRPLREVLI